MFRDYFGLGKSLVKIGHTTLEEHAKIVNFPKELQSLSGFLTRFFGDLRDICARYYQRGGWTEPVCSRLLSLISGYDWVHEIWIHGEKRIRMGECHLDLILNPNLDSDYWGITSPYGVLISAHKKGELLEPANRLIFTIFLSLGVSGTLYIAVNGLLYRYELIEGSLVLTDEILDIPKGQMLSFGDRFPQQIPDESLASKCVSLWKKMKVINPGLVSNLSDFLRHGGILIYANFIGSVFNEARYFQGELKPIAHLVYCGSGVAKVPGGGDLIDLRVVNTDQRITSFLFSRHYSEVMDDIIQRWPTDW